MSPFLYSVMKRFLATAADKKKTYLATLRQKREARLQQEREADDKLQDASQ